MYVALFILAKPWKQLKCLSTDKRINKLWYKGMVVSDKRNRPLINSATWRIPNTFAQWKKTQQKWQYTMWFCLYNILGGKPYQEQQKKINVHQRYRVGKGIGCKGIQEKFLGWWKCSRSWNNMCISIKTHQRIHLKRVNFSFTSINLP